MIEPKTRAPRTDEELWYITPADIARVKLSEEERARLRAINLAKEIERQESLKRLKIEQEPILADLREVGWDVDSVWFFVNTRLKYKTAIPVLLRHLPMPYSDRTRSGLARSLGVPEPEVREAWPLLVREYRKAPDGWGITAPGDHRMYKLDAKNGLAIALSVAVTDATLGELIDLVEDSSLGESRIFLLRALKKSKLPIAQSEIVKLASDPVFEKEIASWKRGMKSRSDKSVGQNANDG